MKKLSFHFFVIAILLFNLNVAKVQANAQDSLVLVALYNNTNGPHWKHHDNWLTNIPLNKWYGVILNNYNRVQQLNLNQNNLLDTIPQEINSLVYLQRLSLAHNHLRGRIPFGIGKLINLTELYLYHNQLKGTIPPGIIKLKNLRYLELSENNLNGIIPADIGKLKNLRIINLSYNQLSGSIPTGIGRLESATNISLAYNNLSGTIPLELELLNNAIEIDLSNNQLNGGIPSQLGNIIRIEGLDLSHNKLSGSIPRQLGNLFWLRFLRLNNNQLSGSIPHQLDTVHLLHYLDLSKNKLSGKISDSLLANLQYYSDVVLRLDSNQFGGKIPGHFKEFHDLYLSNNKFTFSGLVNLVRNFTYPVKGTLEYSPQANIPVHENGNILSVYTGGSYQLTLDTFKWYKNGALTATVIGDSTYIPTGSGDYSVAVTNSVVTGLTLYSDTVNYVAGLNSIASKMNNNSLISIFPNPAKTNATFSFNADGKYVITVTDFSGKILQSKTGVALKGVNTVQLNVSKYASGIYLVTIVDEKNKKQTVRLYKE